MIISSNDLLNDLTDKCVVVNLFLCMLQIFEKKSKMNSRVMALRDSKVEIVSQLHAKVEQLQAIQQHLPPEKRHPLPAVPVLMPEEIPEKKHRYTRATLERYATLRIKMASGLDEQQNGENILELLEQETQHTHTEAQKMHIEDKGVETHSQKQAEELTELEKEMREVEETRNLYQQDKLLKQVSLVRIKNLWRDFIHHNLSNVFLSFCRWRRQCGVSMLSYVCCVMRNKSWMCT